MVGSSLGPRPPSCLRGRTSRILGTARTRVLASIPAQPRAEDSCSTGHPGDAVLYSRPMPAIGWAGATSSSSASPTPIRGCSSTTSSASPRWCALGGADKGRPIDSALEVMSCSHLRPELGRDQLPRRRGRPALIQTATCPARCALAPWRTGSIPGSAHLQAGRSSFSGPATFATTARHLGTDARLTPSTGPVTKDSQLDIPRARWQRLRCLEPGTTHRTRISILSGPCRRAGRGAGCSPRRR